MNKDLILKYKQKKKDYDHYYYMNIKRKKYFKDKYNVIKEYKTIVKIVLGPHYLEF
jgi:hypothetical protein